MFNIRIVKKTTAYILIKEKINVKLVSKLKIKCIIRSI